MKYTISIILTLLVLNLFSQEDAKREQIKQLMEEVILCEGKKPVCNFLMTVKNLDTGFEMNQGVGIVGRNDTPVDSSYQFKIASITKTFVAAVILQLEEEGKLSLKAPIKSYLEPLDFIRYDELLLHKGVNYADSVTIEMLLNHTSGIADVFIDKETRFFLKVLLNKDKAYSPQGFFNLYYKYKLNKHPNNLPGEDFHYSDINYMLLGFIIEEVDKKSLHRSIRDRILLPLDMKSTYFQYVEEVQGSGKNIDAYLNRLNLTEKVNTSYEWAGGGLVSTTFDLALFIEALFANRVFEHTETLERMIDVSETKKLGSSYGFGIIQYDMNGLIFFGHSGFYGSIMAYSPEQNVIISANVGQSNTPFSTGKVMYNVVNIVSNKSSDE